jgi:hypothetical protein
VQLLSTHYFWKICRSFLPSMLVSRFVRGVAPRIKAVVGASFSSLTDRTDASNKHSIRDNDPNNANKYLKSILEGNRKWVESKKTEDPEYFDKLAQPQRPRYLYFGCSDSRVPANQILGKGYGRSLQIFLAALFITNYALDTGLVKYLSTVTLVTSSLETT